MEEFKSKVERIAKKYATLTEKRIDAVLEKNENLDNEVFLQINEGIRLLNHVANTMERIARLQHDNATGGEF